MDAATSPRADIEDELGFLVDAVEQGAAAERLKILAAELAELRGPISAATGGRLLARAQRALLAAMRLDLLDDPVVIIDDEIALPQSWLETYEAFADLDDPPLVFAIAERAGRVLYARRDAL